MCVSAADEKKKDFEQQSLFRGINYVFDNRIGQLVTADVPLHQLPSSRSTSAAAHTRLEGAEEEEEEEERGGEVVCDEGGRLAAAPAGPEPQVFSACFASTKVLALLVPKHLLY